MESLFKETGASAMLTVPMDQVRRRSRVFFPFPPTFFLSGGVVTMSSNGGAAESQGSRMGIYRRELQKYQNGRPVWKMEGGDYYIYFNGINKT